MKAQAWILSLELGVSREYKQNFWIRNSNKGVWLLPELPDSYSQGHSVHRMRGEVPRNLLGQGQQDECHLLDHTGQIYECTRFRRGIHKPNDSTATFCQFLNYLIVPRKSLTDSEPLTESIPFY